MKNYYRILEIEPDADQATIEKAYQKLARRYNPQSNPSKEAAARLKKINEAYQVLGQAGSRREYDAARDRNSGGARSKAAEGEGWSSGRRLLIVIGGVVAIGAIAGGIIAAVVLMNDDDGGDEVIQAFDRVDLASLGATATVNAAGLPPVVATPTVAAGNLQIIDLELGTGQAAAAGATVTVDYTGWLDDGTVFDTSLDNEEPATFPLSGVIPGWQQGIPGMTVGGKRRLIIPPELAYGEAGREGIPPNATLTFDIELLAVAPAPTAPAP